MTISREEYERLLGAIDALKRSVIEIANAMSVEARTGIASEIDIYGSRVILASGADNLPEPLSRREAQQDTAWDIAAKIWPHRTPTSAAEPEA